MRVRSERSKLFFEVHGFVIFLNFEFLLFVLANGEGLRSPRYTELFHLVLLHQTNDCLAHLNISWNGLSLLGCVALGRFLKKNEALESLDIRYQFLKKYKINTCLECY